MPLRITRVVQSSAGNPLISNFSNLWQLICHYILIKGAKKFSFSCAAMFRWLTSDRVATRTSASTRTFSRGSIAHRRWSLVPATAWRLTCGASDASCRSFWLAIRSLPARTSPINSPVLLRSSACLRPSCWSRPSGPDSSSARRDTRATARSVPGRTGRSRWPGDGPGGESTAGRLEPRISRPTPCGTVRTAPSSTSFSAAWIWTHRLGWPQPRRWGTPGSAPGVTASNYNKTSRRILQHRVPAAAWAIYGFTRWLIQLLLRLMAGIIVPTTTTPSLRTQNSPRSSAQCDLVTKLFRLSFLFYSGQGVTLGASGWERRILFTQIGAVYDMKKNTL